jgi:rubrerythrin
MKDQIEKQAIEEIASVLYESDNKPSVFICGIEEVAEALYNAGYRRQSEGLWRVSGDMFKTYFCSECGYSVDRSHQKTRFCPECGAHMRKEDEGK